jgi:purine-binding chemotaxis protein CheW
VFRAAGQLFGLEISTVREVLSKPKVTKLPNVAPHILGVYNLRGNIMTLVDINRILDLDPIENEDTSMIILAENGDFLVSFIIDQILDFVEVDDSKVQTLPKNVPENFAYFMRGIYETEEFGQINLIETNKLLNSEEIFSQEIR